jgi:hypothetical protein
MPFYAIACTITKQLIVKNNAMLIKTTPEIVKEVLKTIFQAYLRNYQNCLTLLLLFFINSTSQEKSFQIEFSHYASRTKDEEDGVNVIQK